MSFIALIFLILCHLITGYGLLTLFGIRQKAVLTLSLSLILGIAVASIIPFLLQLCFLPITTGTVFGSLWLTALLLNVPGLLSIRKKEGLTIPSFIRRWKRRLREGWLGVRNLRMFTYEVPFMVILFFLVFVSVWRCYYLPPTSRDALSGPEAIAEFAVREHTMINSFFKVDLWTTNNQFKSPFLISLQIIYKMAGFPFGQLWLSLLFIPFTIVLYQLLKQRLHPILAGLLLLLYMMAPELYAYTFMILYDYSNMVFLFLGLYFLFDPASRNLYFSGLLLGIATYIRSETLVLALFFIPVFLLLRKKDDYRKMVLSTGLFILPSLIGYYVPVQLYNKHYLPVHYDVSGLVNQHLSDLSALFTRYADIFNKLLTGELAIHLWGYFMFVWAALFVLESIVLRRFNKEARNWLYAIAVVFIGLGLLGYLLPLFNVVETTKRGMFKILPLMLLYMANNQLLIRLSTWISRWENTVPVRSVSLASPAGGPKVASPGKAPVSDKKQPSGKGVPPDRGQPSRQGGSVRKKNRK